MDLSELIVEEFKAILKENSISFTSTYCEDYSKYNYALRIPFNVPGISNKYVYPIYFSIRIANGKLYLDTVSTVGEKELGVRLYNQFSLADPDCFDKALKHISKFVKSRM